MTPIRVCMALSISLALAACGGESTSEQPAATQQPAAPAPAPVEAPATPASDAGHDMDGMDAAAMAGATLAPTEGNSAAGSLSFAVENGAVRVTGQITGLPEDSSLGFHIHETGDCSAPDASSAGGHFNPEDHAHGRRSHGEFHAGDMDNLQTDAEGTVRVDALLDGLEIGSGGDLDIVGKGVIVHAQADDYETQPTGDAGGRLACGVIEQHDR